MGVGTEFFGGCYLLKLCDESVCIQRPTLNHVNLEGMLSEGATLLKMCVGSGYCIQR